MVLERGISSNHETENPGFVVEPRLTPPMSFENQRRCDLCMGVYRDHLRESAQRHDAVN